MHGTVTGAVLLLAVVCTSANAQQPAVTAAAPSPTVATAFHTPSKPKKALDLRRIVDIVDAPMMAKQAMWLDGSRWIGTTLLTSKDEQSTYLLVRRTVSSQAEQHATWDDLVIVRSGAGSIWIGDSLVGGKDRTPTERIGGKLTKSFPIPVHAGDVVRIPATVPHSFQVEGKEPLEYLVVKQRRRSKSPS